ncbi:MAG: imidazole glycerol phosphate synthase subunit HisH [Spirochaetaceae bacterium]|nr:imidazole glycerol phosphate synthase subunit HisH [Spirochaetaceae bacterium]
MIGIVDYGLGNVRAFVNIYERMKVPAALVSSEDELTDADKIILPGVGAFDWAMERLAASGMIDCLNELVLSERRPVLGVCVGMQIMARRSDEGERRGLGWIDEDVRRFESRAEDPSVRLPHMGWNDVVPRDSETLFRNLGEPRYYFLHSYHIAPRDDGLILGRTDYLGTFASAVRSDNIFGVQFHPEKSHAWGVQLLRNFADL